MTQLIELNSQTHGALKVHDNAATLDARQNHLINLRANEIASSACNFPVFVTRVTQSGDWALSGMTGLEVGLNLFVTQDTWDATYFPTALQSYPFYLMQAADSYTIGIDPNNPHISETQGTPVFDNKGQPSMLLNQAKAVLEKNINNDIVTRQFIQALDDGGLLKTIDILVHYQDGTVNTLTGLHTIDEDELQSAPPELFIELRDKGYLAPIYSMLISLYQLNELIQRYNQRSPDTQITQATMQLTRNT
jgi:hypothetical protein